MLTYYYFSECPINNSNSPKDSGFLGQGYPKQQLSPNSRSRHIIYNGDNTVSRRHNGNNQMESTNERRNPLMGPSIPSMSDRRHLPLVSDNRHLGGDRRHISPPLRINICENGNTHSHNLSPVQQQGNNIPLEYSPRRNGRGMYQLSTQNFRNLY